LKKICLNLSQCNALGDLLCATPVIRKLEESYEQKVTVISKMPELFKANPYVEKSFKSTSVDIDYMNEHYIMHNSFYDIGKKNEKGVEIKHNVYDVRQYHAANLGFMLTKKEMHCEYVPTEELSIELPESYVVIHPVQTWASRTWSAENWMNLTKMLNDAGIAVVSIGKDSSETGFFNVQKPVFNFEIPLGLNLMNKTSVSDCWHIINKAAAIITMDSGLLHLAGTTETLILQLGSSINPEFRIPYRHGTQNYKFNYLAGSCGLNCASNMKYGVKQWGSVQGVPPLVGCLEKKETFECHPSVEMVYKTMITYFK